MINIKNLTEKDIGRWVKYTGKVTQIGYIGNFSKKNIFVAYRYIKTERSGYKNFTGEATKPEFLEFDERDSNERKAGYWKGCKEFKK